MSARDYIIARIHPQHPKVLRLAELTGESEYAVVGRAIAWFRHVDQHCHDARTGLGRTAFARIVGHDAYWEAMQDPFVQWITVDEPSKTAVVVQHAANFAKSSKIRHMQAREKAIRREYDRHDERQRQDRSRTDHGQNRDRSRTKPGQITDKTGTDHGQKSDLQQQQQKEQQQQVFGDPLAGAAQPGAADAAAAAAAIPIPADAEPEDRPDTPPVATSPVVAALVAAGVSEPVRASLAALGGITPEIVNRCAARAKAAGKGVGVVVLDIRAEVEAVVERAAQRAGTVAAGRSDEDAKRRKREADDAELAASLAGVEARIAAMSDAEIAHCRAAVLATLKPTDPLHGIWGQADVRDARHRGLRWAIVRAMDEAAKTMGATR